MVLLKVLSGRKAGTAWSVRRFPIRVGRGAGEDIRSDDSGVWDQHLVIRFDPSVGVVLATQGDALASVNGAPVQESVLHNGDTIDLGSLKMQFWLSDTQQTGLRFREGLTWVMLAAISLGQVALIYWLAR